MEASESWRVAESKLVSASCLKLILQITVIFVGVCNKRLPAMNVGHGRRVSGKRRNIL